MITKITLVERIYLKSIRKKVFCAFKDVLKNEIGLIKT